MDFAGLTPVDEPDPRLERAEQARAMPIPVYGLVPQSAIEDWDALSVETASTGGFVDEISVAVSYTLWRHPESPDDPRNLADLDEPTLAAIESEPPWPRPEWILEHLDRMRRPMLWECVRTSWQRERRPWFEVDEVLVAHAAYVLANRFRQQLGLAGGAGHPAAYPLISTRAVEHDVEVEIDGGVLPGVRLDTDPFVVGYGAELPGGGLLTAVLPRDELDYLRPAFARRPHTAPAN
ncbi:hypothetical protein [Agromyces seonyuensis]|uniref:Uncharacterized protein n=1 Tax=Agromyces seonyuensis TaxID=2662446 RepID=A0A6I4NUV3_9MICO|nr:hypothetical protein [Agromyces seonyuensis]MWB97871.1 hypothetical protein [Agromyces seonyuensis]